MLRLHLALLLLLSFIATVCAQHYNIQSYDDAACKVRSVGAAATISGVIGRCEQLADPTLQNAQLTFKVQKLGTNEVNVRACAFDPTCTAAADSAFCISVTCTFGSCCSLGKDGSMVLRQVAATSPSSGDTTPTSDDYTKNNSKGGVSTGIIIGAAVAGAIVLCIALTAFVLYRRRRSKTFNPEVVEVGNNKPQTPQNGYYLEPSTIAIPDNNDSPPHSPPAQNGFQNHPSGQFQYSGGQYYPETQYYAGGNTIDIENSYPSAGSVSSPTSEPPRPERMSYQPPSVPAPDNCPRSSENTYTGNAQTIIEHEDAGPIELPPDYDKVFRAPGGMAAETTTNTSDLITAQPTSSSANPRPSSTFKPIPIISPSVQAYPVSIPDIHPEPSSTKQPLPDPSTTHPTYVCIKAYRKTNADELDIEEGDLVAVLKAFGDGWMEAINLTRGGKGVVPAMCVHPAGMPIQK